MSYPKARETCVRAFGRPGNLFYCARLSFEQVMEMIVEATKMEGI
ncbi:MAG: hypothetical protein OXF24_09725 [Hyphomicrobiales bacterium]|nr:hypothetical protein [Hyphomicrobiales bacterium]MCY4052710.1 hypothetical protein [Hyphomicrobiales bacterium]